MQNLKTLYKCSMANTGATWQQAAHTTSCHILTAQQEPYKKASLLMKKEFSGEQNIIQENGPLAEK
ncbi:MAG: hypothetical protein LGB78_00925 [Sulfurovum sp.]|nr:hypothetical protein [Sulfurovum sp.]